MGYGWPKLFVLFIVFGLSLIDCVQCQEGMSTPSAIPFEGTLVGYVGDPNGRGTASLVISCLLTLVLCVWSALHLNVPQKSDTTVQKLLVTVRWIITGVYAPELVVFTAWRQWCSARLLSDLVASQGFLTGARVFGETKSNHSLWNTWTMTHSFFASTGGFAFDFEGDGSAGFLPVETPQRLTLTARGVALLARCGRLPDIAEAEINDKSKANNVAKALVLIQAVWMLIQVLGRLVVGLPVTLLEVNTIAHVLCAFLMYVMWWNKPLAPQEPHVIRGDWVKPLCAYMLMSSSMSGGDKYQSVKSGTKVKTLLASLHLFSKGPEMESLAYAPDGERVIVDEDASDRPCDIDCPQEARSPSTQSVRTFTIEDPDAVSLTDLAFRPASSACLDQLRSKQLEKASATAFFERRPRAQSPHIESASSSISAIKRWNLAGLAIKIYPAIREHYLYHSHFQDQCLHFKCEELLVPRVHNWPSDDLLRNVGGLVVGMILWLACLAYGGIHLTAWNDHFPSDAEKWLWRSSSLYIGFCGGLWIILNYVAQAYGPLNAFWERWMDGGGRWWQNIIIGVPVLLCGISLMLARAFIVIEAFISIRQLPEAAYDTPSWTQIFPHF